MTHSENDQHINQKPSATLPLQTVNSRIAANFADATELALISVNPSGHIRFANRAATEMFGHTREEMIGQSVKIIIPERFRNAHGKGFARAMAGVAPNLGGKAVEVYALRKDGTELPIELTLCAWHDGRESGAGAVIKDITERRERDTRLLRLANQDVVTGLPNRNRFLETIEVEVFSQRPFTIIIISINCFSDLNDTLGS